MKALGMIEVYGYVPAVEALDNALKAAKVETVEVSLVRGGLVAVFVSGDVGAVKVAIEAASVSASRVGRVISTHVMPRPAQDTARLFSGDCADAVSHDSMSPIAPLDIQEGSDAENIFLDEMPNETERADLEESPEDIACSTEDDVSAVEAADLSEEAIKGMTVSALRCAARTLRIPGMTSHDIRFAKKEELIRVISAYLEQRGR